MEQQEFKGPPPAYNQVQQNKDGYQPNKDGYQPMQPGYTYGYDPQQPQYDAAGQPIYPQQVYGQQSYPPQQPVYQQQPAQYQPAPYLYASPVAPQEFNGPAPKSYSALSWLTCLFCCWPLGVIAIVKSCEVNSAVQHNDMDRANKASEAARKFSMASIFCGVGSYIIGFIFFIFFVVLIPDVSKHHAKY